MDQNTPIRKPYSSTADFLTWPETTASTATPVSASRRTNKPASGISSVMFGGQMSEEEAENVLKSAAKLCSGYKLREITGSGIFASDDKNSAPESTNVANSNNKAGVRINQQTVTGMSQISFGGDESAVPKKHITLPEATKLKEMSGKLENEAEGKLQKHQSEAKCMELCGHDIFGPPPNVSAKPLTARDMELKGHFDFGEPSPSRHTSVTLSNPSNRHTNIIYGDEAEMKTSKKIFSQKYQVLTSNKILENENSAGPAKPLLSSAKLKEMSGSDIFGDGKANSRKYYGGEHKPPGGESSITLV